METVVKSFCLDCEWEISATDYTTEERTTAMIDHADTTGHDIESIMRADCVADVESGTVFSGGEG